MKRIRSIELSDARAVRDIYAPYVSDSAISFEIEPPDLSVIEQRIRSLQPQYPWLVFEVDDEVLGYAYASRHRERMAYQWCVDVSVYIHLSGHRCGIGRALYIALFEILRRQGYVNAYAGITLPNPSSTGFHERLGFERVGVYTRVGYKFGQWHDVVWLQLRLLDPPEPIMHPYPANEILADDSIATMFQQQADTVRYNPASRQ
jgi:L-amino acid N-acyltransferase YncA